MAEEAPEVDPTDEHLGMVLRLEAAFLQVEAEGTYPSPGVLARRMGLSTGYNFNGACSRKRIDLLIEHGYTRRANGRWGKTS